MIYIYVFFLHFIADFLLLSREMGKKKSEDVKVLLEHLGIQFLVMFIGLMFVAIPSIAFSISLLNIVFHGLIDWNIWRLYKKFAHYRIKKGIDKHLQVSYGTREGHVNEWKYYEDHWFYATIGFDQFLHVSTLVMILEILK